MRQRRENSTAEPSKGSKKFMQLQHIALAADLLGFASCTTRSLISINVAMHKVRH